MTMLDMLSDRSCWEAFYEYKLSLACPKRFTAELRRFIDGERYLPVLDAIRRGERFPLPRRSVISKQHSQKKRVVYTYPPDENIVLKLLTYLLIRRFGDTFAAGLYSFRAGVTAKDAIRRLAAVPGVREMYSYKVDVSNYFNSVSIPRLLPMLGNLIPDDPELLGFLEALLTEPCVVSDGRIIEEEKGIMAGTPLSAFYADLYLSEMDSSFDARRIPSARYSDDIIVFAKTAEEAAEYENEIKRTLGAMGLAVNPEKESRTLPGEGWDFLGFHYENGRIDIAPATVMKLKAKMRRKTRALERWKRRTEAGGERAAKAFIRIFNAKLLENPADNELTWSCWFFSVINTTASLHAIDEYAQECIRFLISGRRTKARFNVRYEDMKALGYKSLVHEYYSYKNGPDA